MLIAGLSFACQGDLAVVDADHGEELDSPRGAELPSEEVDGSPVINCGAVGPPLIRIEWDAAPGEADVAALATKSIAATMFNDSERILLISQVRALGDASGVPFELALEPAEFDLDAGASRSLSIELAAVDMAAMQSAGSVEIFARVDNEAGDLEEQSASNAIYFHPVGEGLQVYGAEALRSDLQAGDGFGELEPSLILPKTQRVVVFPTPAWALEGPEVLQ